MQNALPSFVENHVGDILLVEDEMTNMAILSAYLRNAGYRVTTANDGASAWSVLSRNSDFDLLVTDRRMPNMDGLELSLRVRNDTRTKHIPVIMQTGADSQEEMLEGIRAGVFYYLTKPYEEETLLGIVRSAIQNRRQQDVFASRLSRQNVALSTLVSGEFRLRTPDEAQNLALLLGALYATPELAASGLYELMLNAVEHGNLEIGHELKTRLVQEGAWQAEVDRRLALAENRDKNITVRFRRDRGRIEVTIADTGNGFDWHPFMEIEPSRATQGSGRGIAKAALLSFDQVQFQGIGNVVLAVGK